ncbi:MAG TPA: HAMP domain-containing sensor histidine kinase [Rubrobacter sp.]|nr:HAMP domain-containing sensor histidine kinase [Rubrobacter sp.]
MSIRWRLTVFNALAIGAILVLLGIGLFFILRQSLLSNAQSTVQSRTKLAASSLEVEGNSTGEAPNVELEGEAAEQLSLDGVFVVVRNRDGRALYESVNLPPGALKEDTVWREVARTGEPASGTADLSREAPDYIYAMRVGHEGGPPLILEAGRSYSDLEETLGTIGKALAAGIGVAFLLSIGGAYFLARAALRPVDAVVSSAREMSETDLSQRLPVANPRDEIGRLATTINGLLARLETAFGRLEASLARQEEALARQRRFAADASHEFRTPLTAIGGHADMLDEWAIEDPKSARKSVRTIKNEAERLRSLAEALLALARGDEGPSLHVGRHDLGEVASEAVGAARAAANGRVSIEYAAPHSAVRAVFDRDRIRQAASILLDNAIKYTPRGGNVAVRAGETEGRGFLEVSDTGVGIPEEQLPLVFERFYRFDSVRMEGGAGLGLSIARQIAEAHGGTIEIRSKPGEGSTFTLILPSKPPTPPQ